MRIWTIHPKYLDRQGLLALWRETLLARKVLQGRTLGYRHHPQLNRFREHPDPLAAISTYLAEVHREASRRGYNFDGRKIPNRRTGKLIKAASGQVTFESEHLGRKIRKRKGTPRCRLPGKSRPAVHPLFKVIPGPVEPWEKNSQRNRILAGN